jgi:hypothetical protein
MHRAGGADGGQHLLRRGPPGAVLSEWKEPEWHLQTAAATRPRRRQRAAVPSESAVLQMQLGWPVPVLFRSVMRRWCSIVLVLACSGPRSADHADSSPPSTAAATVERAQPTSDLCMLPGSLGSPECNQCLSTNCCAELDACRSDSQCDSVITCLPRCVNDEQGMACAADCIGNQEPLTFLAFDDCWFYECEEQCYN